MSLRLGVHLVLLTALILVGAWLAYAALQRPPPEMTVDGYTAVAYWFALLIYALLSLALYYWLRRRSARALVGAHALALALAAGATAAVISLGYRHAPDDPDAAVADLASLRPWTPVTRWLV